MSLSQRGMTAYYNEHDPFAADWLENLILVGAIAPGVVDRRSVEDVTPDDLKDFTQCHFFAGIGVWSYALRQAGWGDDQPCWTGSCPCQPFSSAGKGTGFDDERHLWPAFHHLITLCGPSVVFGEQVSSKDGLAWLDLVHTDLEATGYAFGALDLCAAGVGAPHIRQRSFWMAHADDAIRRTDRARRDEHDGTNAGWPQGASDLEGRSGPIELAHAPREQHDGSGQCGTGRRSEFADRRKSRVVGVLHDARSQGLAGDDGDPFGQREGTARPIAAPGVFGALDDSAGSRHVGPVENPKRPARDETRVRLPSEGCGPSQLADDPSGGRREERADAGREPSGDCAQGDAPRPIGGGGDMRPGPTNGFWRDADWLGCRDGKWRPVEPGTFPLAARAPNRVGSLRGYGNSIVSPVATEFIKVAMEYLGIDETVNRG